MFWIFGGAYTEGAGSSPHSDGEALARKGAVVVTFNYRLGPFGFFSHPELTQESGHNASGNQALMDTTAALKWVQSNIGAFGGDPRNVTIFGESAGAAIAAGLVGSPHAAGLFRRAISRKRRVDGPRHGGDAHAAAGRAADGTAWGSAAAGADAAPGASSAIEREISRTLVGAGMIVDGWIVPEDESLTFAQGRQQPVDVLVGSNKDEGTFAGNTTAIAWTNRVKQRWGDLADDYLNVYPAGSDEDATRSSQAAFRDELAWHMRLYASSAGEARAARVLVFLHTRAALCAERATSESDACGGNSVCVQQSARAARLSGRELARAGLGIGD